MCGTRQCLIIKILQLWIIRTVLKGLGHEILGSFNTDQLHSQKIGFYITIRAENCWGTRKKNRIAKKGHEWVKLWKIETPDCILENLKHVSPTFFKYISIVLGGAVA